MRPLTAAGAFGTQFADFKTALNVFDAGVTLFPVKLPAGSARLGVRAMSTASRSSARKNLRMIFVDSPTINAINVGRDIEAAYLEASIPVVAPTMKLPGVYSFDLDGAVRVEKYEGINSELGSEGQLRVPSDRGHRRSAAASRSRSSRRRCTRPTVRRGPAPPSRSASAPTAP